MFIVIAAAIAAVLVSGVAFYFNKRRTNKPPSRRGAQRRRVLVTIRHIDPVVGLLNLSEYYYNQGDQQRGLDCFLDALRLCEDRDLIMARLPYELPPQEFLTPAIRLDNEEEAWMR